jgi:glutamate dehydrogenase/leucine dehydrogenase
LLLANCEVLVPAAVHNVIHEGNAREVRARLIVEGANGPVTPAADEILESAGVRVVPDVLANAGGVIVCHFERIQGLTDMYWTRDEVYDRLRQRLLASHAAVEALARELGVSMRLAAWAYGLRRVAEAIHLRGWG